MNKISILFIIWLGICSNLSAQIITDRPDQTESSSTIPKGSLQLESGFLVGYEESNSLSTRQLLLPTNLFRYGISKDVELRLLNQIESIKHDGNSVDGISDLEVGAKFQIVRESSKDVEIAFLTHLIVPTGSEVLTNDEYGTINKLSISHSINEKTGIGYNIGYDYFGKGSGDLTYSVALGTSIGEKTGIYIEPYGILADMDEYISNADAGVTYLAKQNLQLDFSFGTGLNQTMNYTSLGVSWLLQTQD